jgi:WXG100 family type VII secretion target
MSEILVQYGALEQGASQMKAIASTMEGKLADLKGRLAKLQWEGDDRVAYNAYQAQWDSAVADMNQVLAKIGAAVDVARENYQSTEKANQNAWS